MLAMKPTERPDEEVAIVNAPVQQPALVPTARIGKRLFQRMHATPSPRVDVAARDEPAALSRSSHWAVL